MKTVGFKTNNAKWIWDPYSGRILCYGNTGITKSNPEVLWKRTFGKYIDYDGVSRPYWWFESEYQEARKAFEEFNLKEELK